MCFSGSEKSLRKCDKKGSFATVSQLIYKTLTCRLTAR